MWLFDLCVGRWYSHTKQIRNQNQNQSLELWHNEFYELESIINLIRIRIRKQADDTDGHSRVFGVWDWKQERDPLALSYALLIIVM